MPCKLITRADDAGSSPSANRAILETVEAGFIRNVSCMFAGPAAGELAELFGGREDIDLGLHATLNSEWQNFRWGPVLPAERVPTLVQEDGSFTCFPRDLNERGFDADEAIAEIEAQYHRALDLGLKIRYLDEHMGVAWLPGLKERIQDFVARSGLILAAQLSSLPRVSGNFEGPGQAWIAALEAAPAGNYVMVSHPGIAGTEMDDFYLAGGEPKVIARERDAERRALTSPELPEFCARHGVVTCRYSEVLSPAR